MKGLWNLTENELIKNGWRKQTYPPKSQKDILGVSSPGVYIVKSCKKCGSELCLSSFIEAGKVSCACGELYFTRNSLTQLIKTLRPFKVKELPDINWTFGTNSQSDTADWKNPHGRYDKY